MHSSTTAMLDAKSLLHRGIRIDRDWSVFALGADRDWTSNCNRGNTNKVPSVLISGTTAGIFTGFGLVHLPSATDFRARS